MTLSKKIRLGVMLTAITLMTIIILQNTVSVTIQLLLAQVTMPMALLLSTTFLLGISSGFILAFVLLSRRNKASQIESK